MLVVGNRNRDRFYMPEQIESDFDFDTDKIQMRLL